MQDWNYLNTNCFEVTIELGCVKYPMASELPIYWKNNHRSLLEFIKQVSMCLAFVHFIPLSVVHNALTFAFFRYTKESKDLCLMPQMEEVFLMPLSVLLTLIIL